MNDILLYFTIKYKGKWEDIYLALSEKEQVRIQEVKKISQKTKANYISIIDKSYPCNLKTIYKPPFSIFWEGNLELLNNNLISIYGNDFEKFDEQLQYLKQLKDTTFIVQYDNEFLMRKMLNNNFKIIAISNNGLDFNNNNKNYQNLLKTNNLIISEIPSNSKNDYFEQYSDRIFVGLSKKIVLLTDTLTSDFNLLKKICKLENIQIFSFFKEKNAKFLTEETISKLKAKLS